MNAQQEEEQDARVRLDASPFPEKELLVKSAQITEALGELTETRLDVFCHKTLPVLEKFLGQTFVFSVQDEKEGWRQFGGICVQAERLGYFGGHWHYGLHLRPPLWFLTKRSDCRVYQKMNVRTIIEDVLEVAEVKTDIEWKLSASYADRLYTVQYRETDFDFISRLMQQEGIYYFTKVEDGKVKTIFLDTNSRFEPTPVRNEYKFVDKFGSDKGGGGDHIFEFQASERTTTGKVTLDDYDFEKPKSDLAAVQSIPKGTYKFANYEEYDAPGRYIPQAVGDAYTKTRAEAHACAHRICRAIGNIRTMAVGTKFKLTDHPVSANNTEYQVIGAEHWIQNRRAEAEQNTGEPEEDEKQMKIPGKIEFPEDFTDTYRCEIQVLKSDVEFRSARTVPWPKIGGYLTAVVTGPDKEEIHTDEFGRIKVLFHWDRLNEPKENSSCYVRVVTPWSGTNWGMIAIPRIKQEVIIQFEDGDPDRPICTGMLYNNDTMPPYGLPDNKTQQGIKTNSSKGGGGFNELMMEDKKDEELVRFQSEKNYEQIVKNNATITIGLEKADPGDLTQTIHNDVTETIGHDETREIGNDVTETIGNNETREIGNDVTETIGNNETVEVGQNITISAGMNIEIEAGVEILLKVGGSSIKIDNMGVEIKGPMVKLKADAMGEFKAGGMLTLKGGITMIN